MNFTAMLMELDCVLKIVREGVSSDGMKKI